ncbi:MAG TPA: NYN domain-containing protein [Bacilli bacterium]
MNEVLIVDGYNIIGAWPELERLKDVRLEDARDRLIDILAEFQGITGFRVILVFDAHQVPGLGKYYRQHRLQIMYTKEKETADEYIERLVAELAENRNVRIRVATSDQVEQHVIFGKGALRLSARELKLLVDDVFREIKRQTGETKQAGKNPISAKLSEEMRQMMEKWRRDK